MTDQPASQPPATGEEPQYRYDPQAAIQKAGAIQDKIMDHVLTMDMEELVNNPKVMEGINGLLSNVNATGTAVMRNSLVDSNANLGAMADAVLDRMAARGIGLIKTVETTGRTGKIPTDIDIEDVDFEPIQEAMLERGIVTQTYDDFTKAHDMNAE